MFRQLQKFKQLPYQEQKFFCQSYIILGLMRLAILTIPFKYLTCSLNHFPTLESPQSPSPRKIRLAILISNAIQRAANHTPWHSACLAQALTAQRMLQKHQIPGAFYLGVSKSNPENGPMKAHAWSQCGKQILTGGKGHEFFTVISAFTWE